MSVTFTRLSYWLWGTKDLSLNNSSSDSLKFPSVNGTKINSSSSRRFRKKWQSKEERKVRIDREYDVVIVPSDGICLSESESDDSDWSIGWMEPHASDFESSEGEIDASFAVLVPCYGRGRYEKRENVKKHGLGDVAEQFGFSSEGTDFIERWLSSLQDM